MVLHQKEVGTAMCPGVPWEADWVPYLLRRSAFMIEGAFPLKLPCVASLQTCRFSGFKTEVGTNRKCKLLISKEVGTV